MQNFFVVMITPVLINRIQWKTFLVWMALAFSFVPVIYFFYPETSNISLEGEWPISRHRLLCTKATTDIDKIFLQDGDYASDSSSTHVGDHSPERKEAEKTVEGTHVEQV